MFNLFKRKKVSTTPDSNTLQSNNNQPKDGVQLKDSAQPKDGAQILNEIEQIVARKYKDYSIHDNMIYVTTNPSVYARWGSASISIVSNNGFEIHFYLLIETDIEPDFDVFHALFELNVNESKYRFFWQEGIVGIAYVMDYMDNPYILEREILENLDTLSLAALHTHDMFKREYVESMGQHNLFRFIASSPDDELRKKEVPIKLEEYNLSYEKLERHYIEYYLINPTNIMQAHNIELIVDIIDSSEYAFVFKTKIDFMGDYSFEDRCIAGHRFSEAYPRYTFLFDNDYIIMRYTVSLRCYDKSLFEKIVNDMVKTKEYIYELFNPSQSSKKS